MSYDLEFLVPKGSAAPTPADYRAHFRSRPWYTKKGRQFAYFNEDTGVYFSFDLAAAGAKGGRRRGPLPAGLYFNVNYCRPHVFGLEAAIELTALVERFGLQVDDPQEDGMGRGAWSVEGFLRGWDLGNLAGHAAAALGLAGPAPRLGSDSLPRARLEAAWRWNHGRRRLQAELGDGIFVPPVHFIRHEGLVRTLVGWGDAIPQAVPKVDLLLLIRRRLAAPRRRGGEPELCLAPYAELQALKLGRRVRHDPPYLLFDHDEAPRPLVRLFQRHQPLAGKLEGLVPDRVLTCDVLAQVGPPSRGSAAWERA